MSFVQPMFSIIVRLFAACFSSDVAASFPAELRAPERIELVMADDSGEVVKEQSEVVAASNLKVVGDVPAFYIGMQMQNATRHQEAMNQVLKSVAGKIAEEVIHSSRSDAGADLAALHALIKLAQTVPPVSSPPPVSGA